MSDDDHQDNNDDRVRWLAHYEEDGEVAFRIGRANDEIVAEWIGTLRLVIPRKGGEPRFSIDPNANPYDVTKIRRGSAQLLIRHVEGKFAMHGAAVAIKERGVVLLGRSGQGKSTLAAHLCANGATFLADDAVAIDVLTAPQSDQPRYVLTALELDHWIDDAARHALLASTAVKEKEWSDLKNEPTWTGGKAPVRAERVAPGSVPLVAFIDLAYNETSDVVRAIPLKNVDAMASLIPQVVRFVVDEPEVQQREMDVLADLVSRASVYRIERPRELSQLDKTADLVVRMLAESTPNRDES